MERVRRTSTATDPAHPSATQAANGVRPVDLRAALRAIPGRLKVAVAVPVVTVLRTPEAAPVPEARLA